MSFHLPRPTAEAMPRTTTAVAVATVVASLAVKQGAGALSIGGVS